VEIAGLPLHPLVVHAAVVLMPLAVVSAAVFAVVPRWRWLTRWPTAALTLGSVAAVVLAKLSGDDLKQARPELAPLVKVHEARGDLLMWVSIGFAVAVVLAVVLLGSTSPLPSGRGAKAEAVPWLGKLLAALVVAGGLVVLVLVVLTGDAGARAVWG
jgi:hypothetical protein